MAGEKKLQNAVIRWMSRQQKNGVQIHWLKIHGNGMQRSGEPDLIICFEGFFYAVELKFEKNKPTKLQEFRLQQWKNAGGKSFVVNQLDEFKKIFSKTDS